jgi:hypothetical protein
VSRWWRAYEEAVDDPKLQRLPDSLFKAWFNLMCLASRHGGKLPPAEDVAFSLRLSEGRAAAIISGLENRGLIDRDEDGAFRPHNWNARQYKSDTSTDRVKQFRERKSQQDGNVSSTVSVTPPETEQSTEQKPSLRDGSAPKASKDRKKPETRLGDDWKPSDALRLNCRNLGLTDGEINREALKFRNNAQQNDRRCRNWDAAFRNWCLKSLEFAGREPAVEEDGEPARSTSFAITPQSPSWSAWYRHYVAAGRGHAVAEMARIETTCGSWHVPSEWPPERADAA